MPAMTKLEGLNVVFDISRKSLQPTDREWKQLLRAFDALGLYPEEQRKAAAMLGIIDEAGRPTNLEYAKKAHLPWTVDADA